MAEKPNCFQCKHYFVTWDPNSPKGCKAYGMKTAQIPSILVKQVSGQDCLKFEAKKHKPEDKYQ